MDDARPIFCGMRMKAHVLGVATLFLSVVVASGTSASDERATPLEILAATAEPSQADGTAYRPGAMACLAEAVYYESRGRSLKAGHAVAHVVLNRREHEEFPATVCGVVTEDCQFSYRCDGRPENLADEAERERAFRVAKDALEAQAEDPTGGALFFHAETMPPGWFNTRDRTVEIGGNIFYR